MSAQDKAAACALMDVSRETLGRLETYEGLLRKWQRYKNLVAPTSLDHVWVRHFIDSLQLVQLAPEARRWVDVGAGAGFPGMVIAIALADVPGAHVSLVESDNRKCAFLRDVIRETGAAAEVLHARAEDVLADLRNVDVVTARAVASLDKLVEMTRPLLMAGAIGLFPKGRDFAAELTRLTLPSNFTVQTAPSLTDADAAIVIIRGARPVTSATDN